MRPDNAHEIRRSWQQILPHAEGLIVRFYERLFEIDPGARVLFVRADSAAMRRKLLGMLEEVVRLVDDPDRLVAVMAPLGRRHADYGVQPDDYLHAGSALVWALHQTLGDELTEEAADAWRELFHVLSGVMLRAGRPRVEAPHPPG